MNNAVFGKTMEKERKQWYKTCCNRKKKKLFSARIFFAEKLLAIEMKKKTEILMDKPVYLGLSILELKKILMHAWALVWLCKTKIWWKIKIVLHGYRQFHCIHKNSNIYKEIAEDIEARIDTSNYELDRPLPKGKNKKNIVLMKDELDGKIVIKFAAQRARLIVT